MWTFIKRFAAKAPSVNPLPALLDLAQARRVLVIAPHPDDETIGCGGTLAQLARRVEVQVVLVTNGDGDGGLPADASALRKSELAQALQLLGIARPAICMDEPDGHFEDSPEFRRALTEVISQFQPNWVFLPWLDDSHSDHSRIARASCAVLARSGVETVLHYEVWTPVPATHVVDITETAEAKRAALLCHQTALACGNYLEATFGLNAYRSMFVPSRTARWAEAFAVGPARNCGKA